MIWISPQNFTYLSDKLRTEFDTLITKSTSPWLSDTTFVASCRLNISDFLTSWTELTKILNVFSGILWSRSAAQRRSRIEKGIECILKRSTALSHKEGRKARWIYSNDNKVCLEYNKYRGMSGGWSLWWAIGSDKNCLYWHKHNVPD